MASIEGTVSELSSGRPLQDVTVSAGMGGQSKTDASGHYILNELWPGEWELTFHPPSRKIIGNVIATKRIRIEPHARAVVDVQVETGDWYEPPLSSLAGVFDGRYSSGFEQSCFVPHGGVIVAPDGERHDVRSAWVTFSRHVLPAMRAQGSYMVRLRGTLTGPGDYGHCGGSDYELVVDEVVEMEELPNGG